MHSDLSPRRMSHHTKTHLVRPVGTHLPDESRSAVSCYLCFIFKKGTYSPDRGPSAVGVPSEQSGKRKRCWLTRILQACDAYQSYWLLARRANDRGSEHTPLRTLCSRFWRRCGRNFYQGQMVQDMPYSQRAR
jgi:hypothetical protein